METKLDEILNYYKKTFSVTSDLNDVKKELLDNNVEVRGDSFYCEITTQDNQLVLLAGTKDSADMWVLKKIISLIRSGKTFITMFNGNSDHLLYRFSRYDMTVISRVGDVSYIIFNKKG